MQEDKDMPERVAAYVDAALALAGVRLDAAAQARVQATFLANWRVAQDCLQFELPPGEHPAGVYDAGAEDGHAD